MCSPGAPSYDLLHAGFLGRCTPDCLESCSPLAPRPGFASALRGLSTPLTDGETEACGHRPSCARGLGPSLRTWPPSPQPRGLPAGSQGGSGLLQGEAQAQSLEVPCSTSSSHAWGGGGRQHAGRQTGGTGNERGLHRAHVLSDALPHPRQARLTQPRTQLQNSPSPQHDRTAEALGSPWIMSPASLSAPCSICTVHPPRSCRRDPVRT